MAETGKPMPRPGQQLRRVCAGAEPETKKKDVVWFAINEDRPLFAFAGIWNEFKGDRGTKSKPIPGPHLVYGFLTTSPNAVVEPIHPKAMPVILTTDEERDDVPARTLRRPATMPQLEQQPFRSAAEYVDKLLRVARPAPSWNW
jgi:putative SOS response-associated peptidase YedK